MREQPQPSPSSWAASPTGRRCSTPPRRWTRWASRMTPASSRRTARRSGSMTSPTRRATGLQGDHRRRRRRRASARHDGGDDPPSGTRRAGREPRAERPGQPLSIVQMPGGIPGRHAGDRQGGRHQRRASRRAACSRCPIPALAERLAKWRAAQTAAVAELPKDEA